MTYATERGKGGKSSPKVRFPSWEGGGGGTERKRLLPFTQKKECCTKMCVGTDITQCILRASLASRRSNQKIYYKERRRRVRNEREEEEGCRKLSLPSFPLSLRGPWLGFFLLLPPPRGKTYDPSFLDTTHRKYVLACPVQRTNLFFSRCTGLE